MKLMPGSERIFADDKTDPLDGEVRWCPSKSVWIGAMTAAAIILGPMFLTWGALPPVPRHLRRHPLLRTFGRHAPAPDPFQLRVPAMARTLLRLSRHAGRNGRTVRDGALARFPRLGAAPGGDAMTIPAIAPASGTMHGGSCIAGWCCGTRRNSGSNRGWRTTDFTPSSNEPGCGNNCPGRSCSS